MSIRFTRKPVPSSAASSLRAEEARRRAVREATGHHPGRASSPRWAESRRRFAAAVGAGALNVMGGLLSTREKLAAALRALARNLRAAGDALRARRIGARTYPRVRPGSGRIRRGAP
jgi:hypothetical protein